MFMNYILCVFVARLVHFVNGDNDLTTSKMENSSETNTSRIFFTPNGDGATIPEEAVQADFPDFGETTSSDSASNSPQNSNIKHKIFGQNALNLLQNISPSNIVKPIQEQIQRFKDYISHPNNPQISIPLFNPFQILNTLQHKGNYFLSGINGAIFGLAKPENYDYPFPYRSSGFSGNKEDKA